jgi:hypothetical protein
MPIPLLGLAVRAVSSGGLRTAAKAAKKAGVSKAARRTLANTGKLVSKYGPAIIKGSSKKSAASTFKSTTTGKFFGAVGSAISGNARGSDGDSVQRGGSSGLSISKQTLEVLHNIDDDLKNLLTALSVQKQKDEAAAEEARDEESATAVGGDGKPLEEAKNSSTLGNLGKILAGLALFGATLLMPLVNMMKSVFNNLLNLGSSVYDLFSENVLPIFTETLPKLFMEDIPEFFSKKMPEMFKDGIGYLKEKFANILSGITDIMNSIKGKVGDLITGIADSPAAKFLLPSSVIDSVKNFGKDLSSGNKPLFPLFNNNLPVNPPKKDAAPVSAEAAAIDKKIAEQNKLAAAASVQMFEAEKRGDYKEAGRLEQQIAKAHKAAADLQVTRDAAAKAPPAAAPVSAPSSVSSSSMLSSGSQSTASAPTASVSPSGGSMPSPPGAPSAMPSGGGAAATPVSSGGSGNMVSAASMAATAPEPMNPNVNVGANKNTKLVKTDPDPSNPIGNVPEILPNLGSIANLWYHNASA